MIRRPPRSTRTDTTLSLHDALPISGCSRGVTDARSRRKGGRRRAAVSGNRPRGIAPENRPVEGRRENDRMNRMASKLAAAYARDGFVFPLDIVSADEAAALRADLERSEEHTSELQSLMRISYADFCLKKKKDQIERHEN